MKALEDWHYLLRISLKHCRLINYKGFSCRNGVDVFGNLSGESRSYLLGSVFNEIDQLKEGHIKDVWRKSTRTNYSICNQANTGKQIINSVLTPKIKQFHCLSEELKRDVNFP